MTKKKVEQKPSETWIKRLDEKGLGTYLPLEDLGTIVDIFRFLTLPDVRKELGIPDSAVYIDTDYDEKERRYDVSNLYHPTSHESFFQRYSEAELKRMMERHKNRS